MEKGSIVLFWITFLLYATAFIFYVAYFNSRKSKVGNLATLTIACGWLAHTLSLVLRGIGSGHIPGSTAYESLSLIAWFVILGYLMVEQTSKLKVLGIFVTPMSSIFLLRSWFYYQPPGPRLGVLRSALTDAHFLLMYVTFAAFTVAAGSSILYLLQEWQVKKRKQTLLLKRLPSLGALEDTTHRAIIIGFLFFTIVVVIGAVQAQALWGTYFDAIFVSSMLTWLVYGGYLISRFFIGWRGRKGAFLAIIGYLLLLSIRFIVVPYISYFHGFRG